MTIIEKKSERKKKAIMEMVKTGEYSIAYALMEAERLNDENKLLDKDYEELAEWLEALLPVDEPESEPTPESEVEEAPENAEEETQEENSEASEENE